MTPEYRTPEEDRAQGEHIAYLSKVLDQAVRDGVSCKVAMALGEPPEVVERWIDAIWDGLRDGLSDTRPDRAGTRSEDRLAAIVLLLEERITREANALLGSLREASDD